MSLQVISAERLERRCLLSAGQLDLTFGDHGFAPLPASGLIVQRTIAQPDGKLLVEGYTGEYEHRVPTLLRLNPNASLDKTFGGGDGKITLLRGHASAYFSDIALQSDGRILVSVIDDNGNSGFVARLKNSGALDGSFGVNGLVAEGRPTSVAFTSDGIYVASDGQVQRLKSNGSNDPAWNAFSGSEVDDPVVPGLTGFVRGALPAANHRVWVYGTFSGVSIAPSGMIQRP
jgi:uncharacterized delta-60 repeat protein